jgi:hypothetical protein
MLVLSCLPIGSNRAGCPLATNRDPARSKQGATFDGLRQRSYSC